MHLVPVLGLIALSSALFAGGPTTEQMLALSKAAATLSEGASITTRIGGETVRITRRDGQAQVTLQGITFRVPVAPAQPTATNAVMAPVVRQIQQSQLAALPPFLQHYVTLDPGFATWLSGKMILSDHPMAVASLYWDYLSYLNSMHYAPYSA